MKYKVGDFVIFKTFGYTGEKNIKKEFITFGIINSINNIQDLESTKNFYIVDSYEITEDKIISLVSVVKNN